MMKEGEGAGGGMRSACLVGSALALQIAVHSGYGTLNAISLSLLLTSIVLLLAVFFLPAGKWSLAIPAILIAIGVQAYYFATGLYRLPLSVKSETELFGFVNLAVLAAFVCALLYRSGERMGWTLLGGLICLSAAIGLWTINHTPDPGIDVYIFQDMGSAALVEGKNPYTLTFPDIYYPRNSARFYGEGVSVDGVLQFGFPYTPLPLLLSLPGYLFGDIRYATLAAMIAPALVLAFGWRGPGGKLAGAMLLLMPQFMHLLSMSWTEPYQLLLLAGVVVAAKRKSPVTPYLFGLMLVSKQYMVLLAPLMFMLLERPWTWRQAGVFFAKAFVAGCVVTLPMALWDFGAFWHSAVQLQFRQPFRPDALSLLAWARPAAPAKWLWLPIFASGAAIALSLVLNRRRQIPFAAAAALVLLMFFAFNKQAFANYYYLVFGALVCGIVELESRGTRSAQSPEKASLKHAA